MIAFRSVKTFFCASFCSCLTFKGIDLLLICAIHFSALTHLQQKETMDNFREGKHKLLICTPDSAGEGIDVTDCNFVIIYDIMTNEVSVTQIKG